MAMAPSFNLDIPEPNRKKGDWDRVTDLKTINTILTIVQQGLTKFSISADGTRFTADPHRLGEVYTDGRINFLGVRDDISHDKYNDIFYVYWVARDDSTSPPKREFVCYKAEYFTTKPGVASFCGGYGTWNDNGGVAIMCEGWHKNIWTRGLHKGYPALRQYHPYIYSEVVTDSIKIYRDDTFYKKVFLTNKKILRANVNNLKNKGIVLAYDDYGNYQDASEDPEGVSQCEVPQAGINLHHAYDQGNPNVGTNSAGCQVFRYLRPFEDLIDNVINDTECKSKQTKFSYFLTNIRVFKLMSQQIDDYIESVNNSPLSFDFSKTIPEHHPYKIDDYLAFNIYEKCGVLQIGSSEWLTIHMMGRIPSGPAKYFGR